MVVYLIPLAICISASVQDVRSREISDWKSGLILLGGFVAAFTNVIPISLSQALLGVVIAFLITFPITLSDGLSGGDLKLLAALGAWLGPLLALQMLFWTAIVGAAISVVRLSRGKKELPYAPAITAGFVLAAFYPFLLTSVILGIRQLTGS